MRERLWGEGWVLRSESVGNQLLLLCRKRCSDNVKKCGWGYWGEEKWLVNIVLLWWGSVEYWTWENKVEGQRVGERNGGGERWREIQMCMSSSGHERLICAGPFLSPLSHLYINLKPLALPTPFPVALMWVSVCVWQCVGAGEEV